MRRPARLTVVVLAVTALALLIRLVGLGARPFHWDEARVGYWTLRSLETGVYEYRPIAGGPFLYLVNRLLFSLVGASDALARGVVALVGGLLPLSALLFHRPAGRSAREDDAEATPAVGLRADETALLALVLAVAPPLLYYSRFLRGDLPLVAFGLVAVGLFYRARHRRCRRCLYAGGVVSGLALTTSAFAVIMVACWLVAAVLTFDEGRVRREPIHAILDSGRRIVQGVVDWATPLARAGFATLAVTVFFYAPRGGPAGLYDPSTLPAALARATFGTVDRIVGVLILGRQFPPSHRNGHELLPYLADHAELFLATALPFLALALWGFFSERYTGHTRPLVAFTAYWAGVGLLFFPAATEVSAPWLLVHTLTPMAIPAAVGLAALGRYARDSFSAGDAVPIALALLLIAASGVHVGAVLVGDAYAEPDVDSDLAQFAQPDAELRPAVEAMSAAIDGTDGVDVLYVGGSFALEDESAIDSPPVPVDARDAFAARLPLSWYVERAGAETASLERPEGISERPPPVVVTVPVHQADVAGRLGDGYRAYEVDLALSGREVVIFVAN